MGKLLLFIFFGFLFIGCGSESTFAKCINTSEELMFSSDNWSNIEGQFSSDGNLYIRAIEPFDKVNKTSLFAKKIENSEEILRYYFLSRFSINLDENTTLSFDIELSTEQFEKTDEIYVTYKERCFASSLPESLNVNPSEVMEFKEIVQ